MRSWRYDATARRGARSRHRMFAALAAIVVATCTLVVPDASGAADPAWLQLINSIRTANGLAPVTADPSGVAGIRAHLRYLELTPSKYRTGQYANAHTENPASPYYTAAGAAAGGASNLGFGATDVAAIDGWLAAPFHAIGILRPGLQTVAFARDSQTQLAGLNVISGLTGSGTHAAPITYPANGTTTDIAAYTGENPDPLETCGWTSSGLPIVALLPADPTSDVAADLTVPGGATLHTPGSDLCIVTKDDYVTTDPVYGPTGASLLAGDHAVFVIPHARLTAGAYTVRLRQTGHADISWSFTSAPAPARLSVSKVHREDCGAPNGRGYVSVSIGVDNDWSAIDGGSRGFGATIGGVHAQGFSIGVSSSSYGVAGSLLPGRMLLRGPNPATVTVRSTSAQIAATKVTLPKCASNPTRMDISASARTITAGHSVTLGAALRDRSSGIGLAHQAVTLRRRLVGSKTWTTYGLRTNNKGGVRVAGWRPRANAEYLWSWPGSPAGDPFKATIRRIDVRRP